MSWESKYPTFGAFQIEGKNVRVYSGHDDYITIGLGDEITNAAWVDGELNLTLKNGEVRRYHDRNNYIKI